MNAAREDYKQSGHLRVIAGACRPQYTGAHSAALLGGQCTPIQSPAKQPRGLGQNIHHELRMTGASKGVSEQGAEILSAMRLLTRGGDYPPLLRHAAVPLLLR